VRLGGHDNIGVVEGDLIINFPNIYFSIVLVFPSSC
jgi:hypothetical protein